MRPIDTDVLKETLKDMCNESNSIKQRRIEDIMLHNIFPQIIDDEPTIETEFDKGWISVNDRLPDENQKCLVYRNIDNDLKIATGIWHSDRKTFDGLRHGTRLENTIAWMPLPEPPKDGDNDDQP